MWGCIWLSSRKQNPIIKIMCFLIWARSEKKCLKVKKLTVTLAIREVCHLLSEKSGSHLLPENHNASN